MKARFYRSRLQSAAHRRSPTMKRAGIGLVAAVVFFSTFSTAHAQISTREQQVGQNALDAKTAKLNYTEDVLQLLVPGYTMGEAVGDDVSARAHIFVYS